MDIYAISTPFGLTVDIDSDALASGVRCRAMKQSLNTVRTPFEHHSDGLHVKEDRFVNHSQHVNSTGLWLLYNVRCASSFYIVHSVYGVSNLPVAKYGNVPEAEILMGQVRP